MDGSHRPYFLWWTTATVTDLREALRDSDPDVRAYWMGALLREANTRDVWLFVTPATIRTAWDRLQRHLGRSRATGPGMRPNATSISPFEKTRASTRGSSRGYSASFPSSRCRSC